MCSVGQPKTQILGSNRAEQPAAVGLKRADFSDLPTELKRRFHLHWLRSGQGCYGPPGHYKHLCSFFRKTHCDLTADDDNIAWLRAHF